MKLTTAGVAVGFNSRIVGECDTRSPRASISVPTAFWSIRWCLTIFPGIAEH